MNEMNMMPLPRLLSLPNLLVCAVLASAPAWAQNPFSAAVHVNEDIVTYYEIEQRALFLELVRTPGDLYAEALEALVNERLQAQEAERMGVIATPEQIEAGVVEFAARAELGAEQFLREVAQDGVAPETVRDFVANGISWRNVVQGRFGPRIQISDEAAQEALELSTNLENAQILLAEVVVPLTPENEAILAEEMGRLAADLSGDIEQFSEAARRFSVAATRENGGVTGWRPFTAIPPVLREYLQYLRPGETSTPVSLGPAYAIFQMRGIRETGHRRPAVSAIDYATIPIPSIQTPEGQAAMAALRAEVDVCDDLYGQRPGAFERQSAPLRDIATDIGLALSSLDTGEMSFDVTRSSGSATLAVMLCGRELAEGDLGLARQQLFGSQLESYASGLLEELRADAIIVYN